MNLLKELYNSGNIYLKTRLNFFLNNANIGGIRYLSERCGILGKIFWSIILAVSLWGMVKILQLTAERFQSDDISIEIDTAYLHWESTFPAVSLCLVKGSNSNPIISFIKEENVSYKGTAKTFARNLHKYLFVSPNTMPLSQKDCISMNGTCNVDIELFRNKMLPKSCQEVVKNVKFDGKLYENCEHIFKFYETEMGRCFIANSIVHYNYDISKLPLKFMRETEDRLLEFQPIIQNNKFWYITMYIHSPEDLPYFNSEVFYTSEGVQLFDYAVEEISNENGVKESDISHRNCRFHDEKLPESGYHYSFSTCMSDLRIKLELEECNCTLLTGPKKYKNRYCDLKGIECVIQARIQEKVKDLHISQKSSCLPSCTEQRITLIGENRIENDNNLKGYIKINILDLPTVRYIRQVAKTKLDLVVAIGGVAGLFFGASIINIAETIYIWFIRKF